MRGRRPPLDVAAVAGALPAGAVLLQYHCWNDDLVSWALTEGGLHVRRARIDVKVVAADTDPLATAPAESRAEPAAGLGNSLLDLADEHEQTDPNAEPVSDSDVPPVLRPTPLDEGEPASSFAGDLPEAGQRE